jgi:hypothetical protein
MLDIGRLVMMGWDWRLKTAASTGLLFISGWLRCGPWYDDIDCGQLLTRLPERSGSPSIGPVSTDISGAIRRMGEGNENLVYLSPSDFKVSVTCRNISRHGTSGFTSHRKEGLLRTCIHRLAKFEPAIFGSSGKHTNHYTTKATRY